MAVNDENRGRIIQQMSQWKLTDSLIRQFVNGLFAPRELRTLIKHAVNRLKEIES